MACPSCRAAVPPGAIACPACGDSLRRRRTPALWPWALAGLGLATAGVVTRTRAPVGARPVPASADAALHGAPAEEPVRLGASPAVVTGTLRLVVEPPAAVELDGEPLGVLGSREMTLAPGLHRLRVAHPEFEPLERTVRVAPDGEAELQVDLRRHGRRRPLRAP